jgi:tetratricopeptide (TPR) repeat protein
MQHHTHRFAMKRKLLVLSLVLLMVSAVAGQRRTRAPESAADYVSRGNARARKANVNGAIADYTKAIELDPNSADAYHNRGMMRHKKQDADNAIADYSKAIELNPQFTDAYLNRGLLRRNKRELDSAILDFTKVIELNPTSVQGYANRCHTRTDARDYAGAIPDCNKALALDPADAELYFTRGNARNGLSQWGAGIADLTKSIKLHLGANAYNHRAWPYLILNRNDLAYRDALAYLRLKGPTGENVSYVVLIAYFAKRQAGEVVAARVLDEWAARIKSDRWPYAVIRYLRREISEQELLGAVTEKEEMVEARAYLGMNLLLSGQREAALAHLHWARENGTQGNYEHAWVTNALRRLEGGLK